MQHLENLNPQQKKAVLHKDGPLLLVAGAGAGKTKVITHRILNLIKSGVAPSQILAITFTNKAAKEMKERVDKLLSEDKELNLPVSNYSRPFMSTFHALCVHIIRGNSKALGIPRHFSIFDKGDSARAIKDSLKKAELDPKKYEPKMISSIISKQKSNAISLQEYEGQAGNEYFPKIVAEVWREYEGILKREKALDFDDLLLKTVLLFKERKDILEKYQNIWRYIHIDEYQDTNKVQYELSRMLAGKDRNICVVADGDQAIYSWRGANVQNVLNFERNYPNTQVILLEENYRSTKTILAAANDIIKKNKQRVEKNLFTKNEDGDKISVFSAYDEAEEADNISDKAGELISSDVSPSNIAVLYRANFQSRALEEYFLMKDLPYQVLGIRFFARKEVKDILSFIKVALNPDSISDLKRIINVPPRGIGKVTLLKMVEGKEDTLTLATHSRVSDFRRFLSNIKDNVFKLKPSETIRYVLKNSGLENVLKSGGEEEMERLENIRELVSFAAKYDHLSPQEGIEKMLEDAALATDQDELEKENEAVRLMTVHGSKGLEFEYVFIAGLEDGLFPHSSFSDDDSRDDEEERRLFYVALTRAKKKVFLSYASLRTIFGTQKVNMPSEFITDIDDDLIEGATQSISPTPKEKIILID